MAGVKMFSLTVLSCVLSFGLFVSATEPVPVLLWQSYSSSSLSAPSSALRSLNSAEFSDILLKKITDSKPLVLVFAEKALSVEDFTWIGSEAERPFTKLEKVYSSAKSKLYIPDVNGPLTALLNLNDHDYKLENAEMGDEIAPGSKRVVVVHLDSQRPGESRFDMLKRHDSYMSSLYNQLASKATNSKILAVYTGQDVAWTNGDFEDQSSSRSRRVRRAIDSEEASNHTFLSASGIYLYSPSTIEITLSGANKETINLANVLGSPTGDSRKNGDSRLFAKYALAGNEGTAQIVFKFQTSDGMWNLTEVSLTINDDQEGTLKPKSKIEAPLGFSYHCSTTEVFEGQTATLRLLNPQIQPYAANNTFGPTADCVYFFTASILSGLLLTVLLLAITSWGVAMIMGIHTMDRFDDPKGKPLFIGATE